MSCQQRIEYRQGSLSFLDDLWNTLWKHDRVYSGCKFLEFGATLSVLGTPRPWRIR